MRGSHFIDTRSSQHYSQNRTSSPSCRTPQLVPLHASVTFSADHTHAATTNLHIATVRPVRPATINLVAKLDSVPPPLTDVLYEVKTPPMSKHRHAPTTLSVYIAHQCCGSIASVYMMDAKYTSITVGSMPRFTKYAVQPTVRCRRMPSELEDRNAQVVNIAEHCATSTR